MTDDVEHAPGPSAVAGESPGLSADAASDAADHGGGPEDDDEDLHEPVDPHPDTPDDFDDDAAVPRQSEEAVPDDNDDEGDD